MATDLNIWDTLASYFSKSRQNTDPYAGLKTKLDKSLSGSAPPDMIQDPSIAYPRAITPNIEQEAIIQDKMANIAAASQANRVGAIVGENPVVASYVGTPMTMASNAPAVGTGSYENFVNALNREGENSRYVLNKAMADEEAWKAMPLRDRMAMILGNANMSVNDDVKQSINDANMLDQELIKELRKKKKVG